MQRAENPMNEQSVGSNLPGTIGGAAGGALSSIHFIMGQIHWSNITEAVVLTIFCSAAGAVTGYFFNYFLKKLFPIKKDE